MVAASRAMALSHIAGPQPPLQCRMPSPLPMPSQWLPGPSAAEPSDPACDAALESFETLVPCPAALESASLLPNSTSWLDISWLDHWEYAPPDPAIEKMRRSYPAKEKMQQVRWQPLSILAPCVLSW